MVQVQTADPVGGGGGLLGQIIVESVMHRMLHDLHIDNSHRAQGIRHDASQFGEYVRDSFLLPAWKLLERAAVTPRQKGESLESGAVPEGAR